jgi:hypothetical protein
LANLAGLRIFGARRPSQDAPFEDYEEPEEQLDLTPFERRKANMVNTLSSFISKSGSVFFEAMAVSPDSADPVYSLHPLGMNLALHASHAFDEGNAEAIEWIRDQRAEVLSKIARYGPLSPYASPGALVEVDSKDSLLTQGADVAAGLVRFLWARYGLDRVAATFGYVTYNGKRISQADAASIQRGLSALAPPLGTN